MKFHIQSRLNWFLGTPQATKIRQQSKNWKFRNCGSLIPRKIWSPRDICRSCGKTDGLPRCANACKEACKKIGITRRPKTQSKPQVQEAQLCVPLLIRFPSWNYFSFFPWEDTLCTALLLLQISWFFWRIMKFDVNKMTQHKPFFHIKVDLNILIEQK